MNQDLIAGFLLLPLLIGCASGAQAPVQENPVGAPAAPAAKPAEDGALTQQSSIDQVLDAMDARGKDLKDFTAAVKLTEEDANVGTELARTGRIWLQRRGEGNDRVRVVFDKRVTDKGTKPEKLEYVLADGWLLDRDYGRKLNVRRQVLRPGQKINLLKLGEGPFPLPLGQSKTDVHRMFEVKKIEPAPEDPKDTVHLQLTPKAGTEFADKFATIDFWADVNTRMPVRSASLDRNGTTIKTADLSDIAINQNLGEKDFTPEKVNEREWQMRETAFDE